MSIEIKCYSEDDEILFSYSGKQISDIKIIRQIDPSCLSIPVSTADFVLRLEKKEDYVYGKNQKFEIYLDGEFVSYTVLKDVKRIGERNFKFYTESILTKLDDLNFIGYEYKPDNGILLSGLQHAITRIFRESGVDYVFDVEDRLIEGYLPTMSKKNALLNILAIEPRFVNVFTDRKIRFEPFSQEIKKIESKNLSLNSYEENLERDIGISAEYYSYFINVPEGETNILNLFELLYDTKKTKSNGSSEAGEEGEITIYFDSPVLSPQVRGGGKQISRDGDKYTFSSDGTASVWGIPKTKMSNFKSIGNGERKITGIELLNFENVNTALDYWYNYFKSGQKAQLKIFEGFEKKKNKYGSFKYGQKRYGYNQSRQNKFNVGDKISFLLWGEEKIARIEKQTFKLTNGVIVKDAVAQILEE